MHYGSLPGVLAITIALSAGGAAAVDSTWTTVDTGVEVAAGAGDGEATAALA